MNGGELANMLTDGWAAIQGDALVELRKLEGAELSAIISDPPYASGGMSMGEKARSTRDKYTSFGEQGNPYPDFSGDALAQRAWTSFLHEVMAAARKACKPGAVCALFVDWRQLPALTDAIQWAGWTWRGVAVWDKMNSRPQLGRFRQQCEYIVWGSNGPLPIERGVSVLPGLFQVANVPTHERWHQTQKPIELMRQVVRLCEPGGCICDPFAGSGSTLLAALQEGYQALGIEQEAHNVAFIALLVSARRDTRGEAASQAQVNAKLDSIAGGVDDIRVEQRAMRERLDGYAERLARVKSSVKSAHHRLDQMAAPYHPPDSTAG